MIVVDASAVLEVLLRTRRAGKVESLIFEPGVSLNAPHLLDLEVAQVLRRYALAGELDSARAEEALADLRDLPLDRFPHDLFSTRIWALRGNLSAYDAAYVSLAEALGARLVTTDRRLARVPGHRAAVILV